MVLYRGWLCWQGGILQDNEEDHTFLKPLAKHQPDQQGEHTILSYTKPSRYPCQI